MHRIKHGLPLHDPPALALSGPGFRRLGNQAFLGGQFPDRLCIQYVIKSAAGLVEQGLEAAIVRDGAAIGRRSETLHQVSAFDQANNLSDLRARGVSGQHQPATGTSARFQPTALGQPFGHLGEVIEGDAIKVSHLPGGHFFIRMIHQVDEQPEGIVGVVGELQSGWN